ncbi:MAG: GTPase [archaeon]
MPTKKQNRSERSLKNLKKQRGKYQDILLKIIEISDIIIEVIDSRFIDETRNKKIEKIITNKNKRIIYALNKSDLTNKKEINGLYPYVFISCKNRRGSKELRNRIKIESQKIKNPNNYKRIHVGVIGYPNSGKSSVINLLKGKSSAKTGSEAGFTKGIQKIKLDENTLLLDSPGVIPLEKYSQENKEKISQHAKLGARDYSKVKDPEIVVHTILKEYSKQIEKFYDIKANGDSEILIECLGKKLNYLKKRGIVDADRTSRHILKDWQEGKIRV